MPNHFQEIERLVRIKIGNEKIKLTRSTRIVKDLKIDGDDAFELLESYVETLNVDMTGFDFSDYFAPEGIDLIGAFIAIFQSNQPKLKELTLGELEDAATAGSWLVKK